MALFRYKQISEKKSSQYQFIDAENLLLAKKKLHAQNIIADKLIPFDHFRKSFSLSQKEVLLITKDLYYLLHSKLPLYESLVTLKEKYKNNKIYPLMLDLTDWIKYGQPLSKILKEYEKVFSLIYVSMIKSAEKSSHLDRAFLELSKMIETNELWKKKIRDSFLYPSFLLSFSFMILGGLFLFIIPSIAEIFEDRTLHPLTYTVLSISNWMCSHIYLLLISTSILFILVVGALTNIKIKKYIQSYLYNFFLIKDLITKISVVRFTTSLFNLLESTVPIIESLTLAKNSLNHPYLEKDVDRIIEKVKKGEKFSQAIAIF